VGRTSRRTWTDIANTTIGTGNTNIMVLPPHCQRDFSRSARLHQPFLADYVVLYHRFDELDNISGVRGRIAGPVDSVQRFANSRGSQQR